MKLIVNADDFGLCSSVNEGIIEAHKKGIVTSTTVMMNMPLAHETIKYAKEFPNLGFGVHLVLTAGKPLTINHTLTSSSGLFKKSVHLRNQFDLCLDEVYTEFKAQIEAFIQLGLYPSHLDSHHHVHGIKELEEVCQKLANDYHIPFRNKFEKSSPLASKVIFLQDFYQNSVSTNYFHDLLNKKEYQNQTIELMTHPGYHTDELQQISSYHDFREVELNVLTDPTVIKLLNEKRVDLINYQQLK
jgi:chitin disaccharide deacetylase